MASRRKSVGSSEKTPRPTAKTPEERENQLIQAAVDLAEQQLISGEASAQVITHYLKLGSSREKLEQQRLANEVSMLNAKRELMESENRTEVLIANALVAFQSYAGHTPEQIEPEYDDYQD